MLGHVSILHRRQAPHTKASLRKGVGNMEPKTWPPYLSILTRIPPVHSTWVLKSNRYKMALHTFQQPIPEPPFTNSWKVTLSSFDAGPPAPSQSSTASSVEAIEFRKTNWTCKRRPFIFMNTIDYFDLFWKILVQAHCYKIATLETMATKKTTAHHPPQKKNKLQPKMLGHVSVLHRRQAPHTKASLWKGVGNMKPKTWPPYLSILTRIPPVHSTWIYMGSQKQPLQNGIPNLSTTNPRTPLHQFLKSHLVILWCRPSSIITKLHNLLSGIDKKSES